MAQRIIPPVAATGAIDGVNQVFEAPSDYVPGSLAVWINGQLKVPEREDGAVELGGRTFRINEPPKPGDTVLVAYRPR